MIGKPDPDALRADMPDVTDVTHVHVEERVGPAEVSCKACGLLMLPMYEKFIPGQGISVWVCFPCYRGVQVTWGIVA